MATDHLVIGAGAVGLAIARRLAQSGARVILIEAQDAVGLGVSSRSSEVAHAGLYYAPGSLKAELCVEGHSRLRAFVAERNVPHRPCGKLVVAADDGEVARLAGLAAQGQANGAALELIDEGQARRLEPSLSCRAALHSPHTFVFDSAAFMARLRADFEAAGGVLALRTRFLRAAPNAHGWRVTAVTGGEVFQIQSRKLINSAGLGAAEVADRIEGLAADPARMTGLAKGSYFRLLGPSPFSRLIYPLPVAGMLGIHLTLDLAGDARFGPDIQWVERPDYRVDPARGAAFETAIRRYWPGLPEGRLAPAYAGIRPKLLSGAADFIIQGPSHDRPGGLVNLVGIESPGLTSALAIGERVAALVDA